MKVLESIRHLLQEAGVDYIEMEHEPTRTSEQAAKLREVSLEIGGKALVLRTDNVFRLFVLSAARRLDSIAIRRHFGVRRTRFASASELEELTGLVPGSVPPFGRPILPLELYVDDSITANQRIAFNAGSLTHSIIMSVEDYIRLANPILFCFSMSYPADSDPSTG